MFQTRKLTTDNKNKLTLLKSVLTLGPAIVLASCASQAHVQQVPISKPSPVIIVKPKPVPAPQPKPTPQPKDTYSSFSEWKSDFTTRAMSQGYSAYDVSRILDSAQLNSHVISLDSNQA